MKRGKGKDLFVKDNITRYINTALLGIETLIALVQSAIANEDALLRLESKLARIIRP
jgi:hypothetical protein